jgi:hypothetical protein
MGILAVDQLKSRTVAPVTISDDLNVTGVSTVGVLTATSVVVGSAVTANADGIIATGVVTATSFVGNGAGLSGVASTDNINTSTPANFVDINATGIVTSVNYVGSKQLTVENANITGVITAGTFSGVSSWDSYDSWLYN